MVGRLNKEVALGTAEVHRFNGVHISVRDEDSPKLSDWRQERAASVAEIEDSNVELNPGRICHGGCRSLDRIDLLHAGRTQPQETHWRYRMTRTRASPIAALGYMSACIVHEITQPVTALLTNTEAALRFLDRPNPDLEESQHALVHVLQLGYRIVEIVRRTRDLLQSVSPQKDDFEINQAIREIISLSKEDQIKNDVSVHTQFAQGLPLVRADQIQMQQVILNLITNAVEAMSGVYQGTRELCISTGQTAGGDVLVTVQDSGPGMDPQCPGDPFEASYSNKPRGLGIGLSICGAIIEAHGGRLWASVSEPHGATFQFTLPQIHSDLTPRDRLRRSKIEVEECAASESTE